MKCQSCDNEADPEFTMDYTDIDSGYIYWCSSCGSRARGLEKAIYLAFETKPGFANELEKAIRQYEN